MSAELSPSTSLLVEQLFVGDNQQEIPAPPESERTSTNGLRNRLLSAVTAGLVVAGTIVAGEVASEGVANASIVYSDLGYPNPNMPCEHPNSAGVYATTGPCANYDWGPVHTTKLDDPSELSSRGFAYRNCTDYVAWKENTLGITVPPGWGDGGWWYDKASAAQQSLTPQAGDAAVKSGTPGHVAYVESVNADGTITISEYNHDEMGDGDTQTDTATALGFTEFVNFGVHSTAGSSDSTPTPDPNTALQMLLTPSQAVYGKVVNGNGGWNRESADGTITKIAAGGYVQMALANDGEVWARNTDTSGTSWTKESDAGTGADIAVSSTGVQMVRTTDNEVWAKNGIGYGGWTGEAGAGTAAAIAAGGDNQMLITGDGKVYAKNSIGVNGWSQETDAGVGVPASVSTAGLQMLETTDGEVWSMTSIGYNNWTGEASPGTTIAVATGG